MSLAMHDWIGDIAEASRRVFPCRIIRWVCMTAIAATIFAVVASAMISLAAISDDSASWLEAEIFPVISNVVIDRAEATPYGTRSWGHAMKRRSCRWEAVEWYLDDDEGGSVSIPITIEESSKIRKSGRFDFGPWVVPITPDELLHHSWSRSVHECHVGWMTRSMFWDGTR